MPQKPLSPEEMRVREWFRQRLLDAIGPERGAQSKLAKKIGISTAHMSNVTSDVRNLGETVQRKIAERHLRMTYSEALARAEGRTAAFAEWDPPIGTLLDAIDGRHKRPGLLEVIAENPSWKTSTIARAVLTKYDSPDGVPRDGWPRVLQAIESGEADRFVGGAKEAIAGARKQRGRAPKLPGVG